MQAKTDKITALEKYRERSQPCFLFLAVSLCCTIVSNTAVPNQVVNCGACIVEICTLWFSIHGQWNIEIYSEALQFPLLHI